MSSPLFDVIVEHPHPCQKGDPFGHHHGVVDCLASCSRKFSTLFQLFNQSGKGFRGVVGPHHLDCILIKVNFVNPPVAGENILYHGECRHLSKPVNWSTSGYSKTGSITVTICFFRVPSMVVYFQHSAWFFRTFQLRALVIGRSSCSEGSRLGCAAAQIQILFFYVLIVRHRRCEVSVLASSGV